MFPGQALTIFSIAASVCQSSSVVAAGPATRSSAWAVSRTVVIRPGEVIEVRGPHWVGLDCTALSSPSIARAGDATAKRVSGLLRIPRSKSASHSPLTAAAR